MKELSIEEEAQRYKEAIKRAKYLKENTDGVGAKDVSACFEYIFPELKESEDEKIRKAIIEQLKSRGQGSFAGYPMPTILAWLEKQTSVDNANKEYWREYREGKQEIIDKYAELEKKEEPHYNQLTTEMEDVLNKYIDMQNNSKNPCEGCDNKVKNCHNFPCDIKKAYDKQKLIDKVETKFHEGDWIVSNVSHEDYRICKILKIENGEYVIESVYGYQGHNNFETFDKVYHLWTLQDAKDGDILQLGASTVIFKEYIGQGKCIYYCSFCNHGGFKIPKIDNNDNVYGTTFYTYPATKERRDLLFKKMKEAGYEWDAEKKELKKVEQKPDNKVEPKFNVGNWYQCTKDFFGKGVTFDKNTAYYCAKEGCLQNEYGCHIAIVKDLYDNFKLWTIQDAKDGDVLVTNSNIIFIFKYLDEGGTIAFRASCTENSGVYFPKIKERLCDQDVHPATKEQCNTLMKAMGDSGYTFDFKKKELKKLIDNVEIKFHKGEWIVWENKWHKVNYNGCGYGLIDQFGLSTSLEYRTIDEHARLWTLQDAKDGDILVCNDGRPFIFKKLQYGCYPKAPVAYCGITNTDDFVISSGITWWVCDEHVEPATKEQRDTLMKAMVNAGYTFDFEGKKLKKIKSKFNIGDVIEFNGPGHKKYTIKEIHGMSHYTNSDGQNMDMSYTDDNFKLVEQNTDELMEDDETMIDTIIKDLERHGGDSAYLAEINYLKSLKERIQIKQNWSEEDESMCKTTIFYLENTKDSCAAACVPYIVRCIKWLKSLKQKNNYE